MVFILSVRNDMGRTDTLLGIQIIVVSQDNFLALFQHPSIMAKGKDYVMESYYRNYPKLTTVKRKRPPFTPEEDVRIINFGQFHS